MPKKIRKDYSIVGAAGEFQVAAEIAKRGVVVTLTLKNTANIDILATSPKNGNFANIQVKARSVENKYGWLLNSKVEKSTKFPRHFYVFVNLKQDALPDYYIIPFNVFAKFVTKRHHIYLETKNRHGQLRKDSTIRNFKPDGQDKAFAKKYLNRWDLLKLF